MQAAVRRAGTGRSAPLAVEAGSQFLDLPLERTELFAARWRFAVSVEESAHHGLSDRSCGPALLAQRAR